MWAGSSFCREPHQHITCYPWKKQQQLHILKPHKEHSLRGGRETTPRSLYASHSPYRATAATSYPSKGKTPIIVSACTVAAALMNTQHSWGGVVAELRRADSQACKWGWVMREERPRVTLPSLAQHGVTTVQQGEEAALKATRASAQHKENIDKLLLVATKAAKWITT